MKIAIQGHNTRGKDVIKIFESIGGINKLRLNGDNSYAYYYINENNCIKNNYIDDELGVNTQQYKLYTLEEFEKEFPFKIGDKVVFKKDYSMPIYVYTITGFEFYRNEFCYLLDDSHLHYSASKLKLYQPMKEERNITLTLDKAKEWYNKGGELKEIALQAFTKEELTQLPKSWEEYCKTHHVMLEKYVFASWCPQKYVALWKLEQLRYCYRQGWEPNWTNDHADKYCITISSYKPLITTRTVAVKFLAFQSQEIAEEFLKNFESLIKEAGDLI